MGTEIERKFLVVGDSWQNGVVRKRVVRQGYLSSNAKATVRIRIFDDKEAVLTIKGPTSGISRSEFEYSIPLHEGQALIDLARPNVIEKARHDVPVSGENWEVDVFQGAHEGLVLAEIELRSVDQPVALPDWAGVEVSDDDRYFNASLARTPGVPQR